MFRFLILYISVAFTLLIGNVCNAETVVRLTIQQGTVVDTVELKLFDVDKPITVSNFMSYVNDDSYNSSFIHRSVPDFIIQGGGFKFDPNNSDFLTSVSPLSDKGTIVNEPGISNLRGTIAMAKVAAQFEEGGGCVVEGPGCTLIPGTGEDSATSEWFINLDDNSTILDTQNGGFTVFGEVLNGGMQIIDSVAAIQPDNLGAPFDEIPLVDFLIDPVLTHHLVKVVEVNGLINISPDYDYGSVTPGSNLQPEFFIENISDANLVISGIGNNNPVADVFSIKASTCINTVLQSGEKCFFVVSFRPQETKIYSDSFNVEFTELGLDYTIKLTGQGGAVISEPDISLAFSTLGFRTADFGTVDVLYDATADPYQLNMGFQNIAELPLIITSVDINTINSDEFELTGDCLLSTEILKNGLCILTLDFTPLTPGNKSATILLNSNDPDESPFEIYITADAILENDGVDASIENAAPNNGDANYDGVLDSQQGHVVSLPDLSGNYITYTGDSAIRYSNVQFMDRSSYPNIPENVASGTGVFKFSINDLKTDEVVKIGIILPASMNPQSFYVFGETDENAELHWYDLNFDGETGVAIIPDASFLSDDGITVKGTFVTLSLKNAGRGDSSVDLDESITVIGGFYQQPSSGSSGSISLISLFIILLVNLTRVKLQLNSNFIIKK